MARSGKRSTQCSTTRTCRSAEQLVLIVDDHLALARVAAVIGPSELGDDEIVTTGLWYLRLVAATTAPGSDRRPGRIRRALLALPNPDQVQSDLLNPNARLLRVLHPMDSAVETATVQREQRLNVLLAETLGAALHHDARIAFASPNAGGPIEAAAKRVGVEFRTIGK